MPFTDTGVVFFAILSINNVSFAFDLFAYCTKYVNKPHGIRYLVVSTWYMTDFALIKSKYYASSTFYRGLRLTKMTDYQIATPEVHVNY